MSKQHTPGPWQLSTVPFELRNHDSAASIYGPTSIRGGACLIADISRSPGDNQATANAQLIAAAPDMLEALSGIVSMLNAPLKSTSPFQLMKLLERTREKAESALSKAKGLNAKQ